MNYSFLEFIEKRNKYSINESFNIDDVDKACEAIDKILKKHIKNLLPLVGFAEIIENNKKLLSKQYIVVNKKNSIMFQINFDKSVSSVSAYSIDFFKDSSVLLSDQNIKSDLTVYTLGTSIVFFLPVIWEVVNKQKFDLTDKEAIEFGRQVFKNDKVKESLCYCQNVPYHIIEGLSSDMINDIFDLTLNEEVAEPIKKYKQQKQAAAHDAYVHRNDSPEAKELFNKLNDEYLIVKNAIKGGMGDTWKNLKAATASNVSIQVEIDNEIQKLEEKVEQEKNERSTPEEVFKKMQGYVKMVIKGLTPSVIICGAPGVGKTYKVTQMLKANGYNEGHNLFTIKGKCSARMLYLTLYDHKEKKDIVLIDDADSLVGPNASEDCINILKAALDSTSNEEGRLVSYTVAGPLKDDEGLDIPKRFYYNGGVIVITNWNAGKLDTALRGRSYIQDINFTVEETLHIIETLLPAIEPNRLSDNAKRKAFKYLIELANKGSDMEISIRTFALCAKIYESCNADPDFDDDIAESMIKEQMKLQASRGGAKY